MITLEINNQAHDAKINIKFKFEQFIKVFILPEQQRLNNMCFQYLRYLH